MQCWSARAGALNSIVVFLLVLLRITAASTDGSAESAKAFNSWLLKGQPYGAQKRLMSSSDMFKNRRERQTQIAPHKTPNCFFSPVQCVLYAPMQNIQQRLRVGATDGLEVVRSLNGNQASRKRQAERHKIALLQRWRTTEGLPSGRMRM